MPWVNNELRHILSASDMFIYPSFSYGAGKNSSDIQWPSLIDGIARYFNIVGSINEVVIDRETGILVKPEDVQILKEAMIELGQDEDLRHKMGKAGRNYV